MAANDNKFHQTVHWRRIRSILGRLSNLEKVNLKEFDTESIRCYQSKGISLKGRNVVCKNGVESYFVSDNDYDVFEVPSLMNKKGCPYGKFLILIHNTSFDYWMFGFMNVSYDKTKSIAKKFLEESVRFWIFGHYKIVTSDNREIYVSKTTRNADIGCSDNSRPFDFADVRKNAYGTSSGKFLAKLLGTNHNVAAIKSGDKVKIYKKSKRKF